MDERERANPYDESVQAAQDAQQQKLWTALPGIIESFDPGAMTAVVQPAVQGIQPLPNGSNKAITMPLLLDCPVQFPGGGGATLTFPVTAGDECLVVFASRCIDAWWQQGGVQPQAEQRMHDLSDGFVLLGFRSQPRKLSDLSATSTQLRSDDGATVVDLDPVAQTLMLTAPGGATITADTTINGTLHVTGLITSDDDVQAGSISLLNHKHGGVQTGGGETGVPE